MPGFPAILVHFPPWEGRDYGKGKQAWAGGERELESFVYLGTFNLSWKCSLWKDMQLYSLVVTTDADVQEREALAEAHHHQPMVEEAPAVLTFCADFHRFSRWCEERKAEPGYGDFVSFINAATDTLLFAQAFITLAEERGLGTCILGARTRYLHSRHHCLQSGPDYRSPASAALSGAGADRHPRMAGRGPGAD